MAGLYTEVWTGEIIKKLRTGLESVGWLKEIRSYDSYAKNNVINFTQLGGDPTVLINNTTYPLEVETLEDANKAISLDKYQTKPTKVTDDELHAISYDKMATVIERHTEAINEKKYIKALHAIAPNGDTNDTPIILTTGEAEEGRKRIKVADIIEMKKKFDAMKVPVEGRILVLCADHVNDLLLEDRAFQTQYNNYTTGKIANLYGFKVYEFQDTPYYTRATKKKLAFGAVASDTEGSASIAFYAPYMMKAQGETKTYLRDAATDPENQENLVSFRDYFICLPKKEQAMGAIVSANA